MSARKANGSVGSVGSVGGKQNKNKKQVQEQGVADWWLAVLAVMSSRKDGCRGKEEILMPGQPR